jgi:hypothetical protein
LGKPAPLAREQRRALGRLKSVIAETGLYLAGGGAVALHARHRQSNDIDLFGSTDTLDLDQLRGRLLAALDDVQVVSQTDATLHVRVGDAVVDVVQYPYPLLEPPTPGPHGVPVAGLRDLAAMKLAAVAKRGLRRDFWDLYAIVDSGVPLREGAQAYVRRFGVAESDLYFVIRALTFFDDAEAEPVFPAGLSARRWAAIKKYFRGAAPELLARPE